MARIIQYDLNENIKGCLREIYKIYIEKSESRGIEIEEIYLSNDELKRIIDNYFRNIRDIQEKSKKGILVQLKYCLEQREDNENVYYLTPLTNLLRLKSEKIENEILYVGLLKYADNTLDIIKEIHNLFGANRVLTKSKNHFNTNLTLRMTELEKGKEDPLGATSVSKNVRRSIDNLIRINLIFDSKSDRSLQKSQIRIKRYIPDHRVVLILYSQESKEKNLVMRSLDNLIKDYDFVKYFFLTKQTLKECLRPGELNNDFSYHIQIGDAIKLNYNEWELSKR